MPHEVKVTPSPGFSIQENGIFNIKRILAESKAWLREYSYTFNELKRTHKTGNYGEITEITFQGERKATELAKFVITIDFTFKDINPAGQDLYAGKADILIKAVAIFDYKNDWSQTKTRNFIMNIGKRTFLKDTIDKYSKKLDIESKNLATTIKEVLDFYR